MGARFLALVWFVVLSFACSRDARERTERPRVAPAITTAAPFDLARVMRVAHFAYRAHGEGFHASDRAYEISVDREAMTVTPYAHRKRGTPVSIRTTSIRRGERDLLDVTSGRRVDDEGSLLANRGEVVERLHNDERGVELSWLLAGKPAGGGDLSVVLRVDGAAPGFVDTAGARFGEIRIGHATWIDGDGRATAVPLIVDGNEVRLRVPAGVVESSRFPAVLDPVISPEIPIDGAAAAGYANSTQLDPASVCGSTNCLIVWTDLRRAELSDIFGARVDKTGALLDPVAFPIGLNRKELDYPAVSWDGTQYVVTYTSEVGQTSATGGLVRVSAAGAVLDAPAVAVSIGHASRPGIACGGSTCLVAGVDSGGTVRFVRYNSSGIALDSTPRAIATGALANRVSVAYLAGTWLVAWTDSALRARTMRINTTGTLLDTAPGTVATGTSAQHSVVLAASTSGFFAVWGNVQSRPTEITAARIDASGAALDGPGVVVRKGDMWSPSVAYDGVNFVVGFTETVSVTPIRSDASAARVSTAGRLLDAVPTRLTAGGMAIVGTVAATGTETLVTYSVLTSGPSGYEFYARRVSTSGTAVGSATLITPAATHQSEPAVAAGGAQYLVVWNDIRETGYAAENVYGARVSSTGTVLDPTGIALASQPGVREMDPAVSFDGTNWLVVWSQDDLIHGRRVDPTGKLMETAPFVVYSTIAGQLYPAICFDGTNHLVTWKNRGGTEGIDAIVLDKTGKAVSALVQPQVTRHQPPSCAFDGSNFLVVATENSFSSGVDVDGRLVSPGGALASSRFVVGASAFDQRRPRVACDTTQCLVVWEDQRNSAGLDVYGARVKGAVVLDPGGIPIALGPRDQALPSVAFDGRDFVVVWDADNGGTNGHDAVAAFIAGDGRIRGPSPLAIAATADDERHPVIAAPSTANRLVAYSRFDATAPYGGYRTRGRLVTGSAGGTTCTTASDCLSGFCVDGVCCDSACTSQCEACDVTGNVGWCTAVSGAPHGARTACGGTGAGTPCGARCDGVERTKCNFPAADSVACSATACTSGLETHASTCDGLGGCKDVPKMCGAYACGPTACRTSCTSSTDCVTGFACKDSACVPVAGLGDACATTAACGSGLFCTDSVCCASASCAAGESCALGKGKCAKVNGSACGIDAECGSAHCVDGVCCDTVCAGQCEACDVEGSKGKCLPISGAPHGSRTACDKGTNLCSARTCNGTEDTSKCTGFANGSGAQCRAARCEDGKFFSSATCTGAGSCGISSETSCVPYACAATGCRTSCETADHCASGFTCLSGRCEAIGAKCSDDGVELVSADGTRTTCAPFLCRGGACVARCESGADCAPDNTCSADGRCVARAPRTEVEDGGGCGLGRGAPGSALAMMIAAWMASRRRREKVL